ncbi:MAG: hypothetical protein U9N56_10360 [Actinomycetota bacterium]|nr:hypothetical protein [Actinomycetota bacterium]
MPYRLMYLGLALVGLAAIALGIVFSAEGETVELPGALESVSPDPGSLVPLQTSIEIDFQVGYQADIWVDGWPITDATFVEGTGVYRWQPSPSSPAITEWTPGEHTVRVSWDTYAGLPDPGTYEWSFRVG